MKKLKGELYKVTEKPVKKKPFVLNFDQKLDFELLSRWRYYKSKSEKTAESYILSDNEILDIVTQDNLTKNKLYDILPKKITTNGFDQIKSLLGPLDR